ncbi:MAG: hypothetical protein R6U58_05215 [Bacteroidales bacterium]
MKTVKNFSILFKKSILFLFALALLSSCSKDDIEKGGVGFLFKAIYLNPGSSASLKSASASNEEELSNSVIVETFKINISEIELEFDDDDPLFATDSFASDIELEGPFEIDLMLEGMALEAFIADNVELPVAAYEEIEFEFEENENSISEMFKKTILVKGTIDGTPFVFWHDEDFDMEIEFDNTVHLDEAKQAIITVSFDIVSMFDPSNGGVDISAAMDENQNGIIEIYPDDPDGNETLADRLMDRIEDVIDAFEDRFDD